jgi:hypothetical protein
MTSTGGKVEVMAEIADLTASACERSHAMGVALDGPPSSVDLIFVIRNENKRRRKYTLVEER